MRHKPSDVEPWTYMTCVDVLVCKRCDKPIWAGDLFGATKPGAVHIECPTPWEPTVIHGNPHAQRSLPANLKAVR